MKEKEEEVEVEDWGDQGGEEEEDEVKEIERECGDG